MRKRGRGFHWPPVSDGFPFLAAAAAFFALGGAAGFWAALQAGADVLPDCLSRFLTAAEQGALAPPALVEVVWKTFRWPLAAFLLGLSAAGLAGIPALCFLRGFFLAFSVGAFALALGVKGVLLSFLVVGVPCLASLPGFFLACTQGLHRSWESGEVSRQEAGPVLAASCAAVVLELFLVPSLLTALSGTIL